MENVDLIIADARRAFQSRRAEIERSIEPKLRSTAMRTQIFDEMAIVRQVIQLMAPIRT